MMIDLWRLYLWPVRVTYSVIMEITIGIDAPRNAPVTLVGTTRILELKRSQYRLSGTKAGP